MKYKVQVGDLHLLDSNFAIAPVGTPIKILINDDGSFIVQFTCKNDSLDPNPRIMTTSLDSGVISITLINPGFLFGNKDPLHFGTSKDRSVLKITGGEVADLFLVYRAQSFGEVNNTLSHQVFYSIFARKSA